MNELILDNKTYVSSKRAAEITGYAKDYVGQLCREGRVEARLVGRNWYILKSAIEKHRFVPEEQDLKEEATAKQGHSAWNTPQYKPDEPIELPVINKLEEALESPEESEVALPTTVEAMQEAWHAWFNRDDKIVQEPTEEAENVDGVISIHPLTQSINVPESLNLRRIREYSPKVPKEEAVIISERIAYPKQSSGNYRVLQVIFISIAIVAVGVGYIASGFLTDYSNLYKPVSLIAGVTMYK